MNRAISRIGLYLLAAVLLLQTQAIAAPVGLIKKTGFSGGLVVHVGAADTKLGQQFVAGSANSVVRVLMKDGVATAREELCERNLLGRVFADPWDGLHLPQVNGSVNLLIVESPVEPAEIRRVLAPGGNALVKNKDGWKTITQRRPKEIDDWTHYLYDAGNNPVSKDTKVAAPKRMQWWAPPKYSRSHEIESSVPVAVTAGGRIVYIVDEGLTGITDPRLPETWALVGRDAFSGVTLWKVPLPDWGWPQWRPQRANTPFNIQDYYAAKPPVALPRRLVMDGDHVFVTLGWKVPVSMLDASTGRTLTTFGETEGTQEILHYKGILYLVVSENPNEGRGQRFVAAVETKGKRILWKSTSDNIQPEMFAVQGEHVYYHTHKEMLCLDRQNGKVKWRHPDNRRNDYYLGGNGLIVTERAVYIINKRSLLALDPASGKVLWKERGMTGSAGGAGSNLFEINGLVWGASGTVSGFKGLDPTTGKVSKTLNDKGAISRGHHIRCFRGRATTRYIIWPKRGTEFLELDGDNHSRHDWVRGSCRYGLMPANGMLYVPPHQCSCYSGVLLNGFMALTPARNAKPASSQPQLEKGPAFKSATAGKVNDEDWPCYRRSSLRLGSTGTLVEPKPKVEWTTKVGGRLSPPVMAAGHVYVVQTEQGIVNALDAETGKLKWRFITGYRIDSPPTVLDGRVLFGCNDGYVYCLRASDGELAWRRRIAPYERRIVVDDQLESPWPVGGSVLTVNGLAYVVAGRSSYLDGGLFLYALDPATGNVKHSYNFDGPRYEEGEKAGRGFEMEGSLGDLLSTDGKKIYLFANVFSLDLKREAYKPDRNGIIPQGLHVITTGGFADDHAWNRNSWMYTKRWPGFYIANQSPKAGQLLVVDENNTYAVKQYTTRNLLSPMFFPQSQGYLLFADDNDNEPILYGEPGAPKPVRWLPEVPNHQRTRRLAKFDNKSYNRDKYTGYSRAKPSKWQKWIPVRVRAMVCTGNSLFAAGPPDILKKDDELAAFQGRAGAKLLTVNPDDGKIVNELDLKSPPVFDGLIAAQGHLYMCTRSGDVIRFR